MSGFPRDRQPVSSSPRPTREPVPVGPGTPGAECQSWACVSLSRTEGEGHSRDAQPPPAHPATLSIVSQEPHRPAS